MFVLWLERARAERLAGVAALASAEAQTAAARGVVAAARSAARVVEYTIDERAAVAQSQAEKRDQHAMDEISRGRHGAGCLEPRRSQRVNGGADLTRQEEDAIGGGAGTREPNSTRRSLDHGWLMNEAAQQWAPAR